MAQINLIENLAKMLEDEKWNVGYYTQKLEESKAKVEIYAKALKGLEDQEKDGEAFNRPITN